MEQGWLMRGFRGGAVTTFLVSACCLLAAACSSGSSAPAEPTGDAGGASPGAGGVPGEGGRAAGGAASGGSNTSGGGSSASGGSSGARPSLLAACRAYVRAQCARRRTCRGDPPDPTACANLETLCPDLLFATGSQRTLEQTVACTDEWANLPCEQLNADEDPPCALPGTLPAGATCVSSLQCASVRCSRTECGTCRGVALVGQPCDAASVCADSLGCVSGTCVPLGPFVADGAPCGAGAGRCTANSYCSGSGGATTGICRPLPTSGQPCVSGVGFPCAGGLSCGADDLCAPLGRLGEPCVGDVFPCEPGGTCNDAPVPTCVPLPGKDEACVFGLATTPIQGACAGALWCDNGACRDLAPEGEACPPGGRACEPGTECAAGLCRAVDSLGLSEACAP